jgi:WD40-like Beta Propeller Repeat
MIWRLISLAAIGMSAVWLSLFARSAPAAGDPMSAASGDIAFASRREGNWEIYVMDKEGRNQNRLTRRDSEDRFPLWSPDRRHIAFASLVGATWELWVMHADAFIDSSPSRLSSRQRDLLAKVQGRRSSPLISFGLRSSFPEGRDEEQSENEQNHRVQPHQSQKA